MRFFSKLPKKDSTTALPINATGCLDLPEPQRQSFGASACAVHAVQKQHVKMDVEVQRTAEALDQSHGAGYSRGDHPITLGRKPL